MPEQIVYVKTARNGYKMTKRVKVYAHRSKESNFEFIERLGLSETAEDNLKYLGYEIELIYDINIKTGEAKLVAADGFFLSDEKVTAGEVEVSE